MQWLRFVALVLVGTLLQADLLKVISIASVQPNLLIIFLVFFAIYCEKKDAIIASFAIGFAFDLISTSMGPATISFGLIGTGISYLSKVFRLRRMPFQAAAIFLTVIATAIFCYFFRRIQQQPEYHEFWEPAFMTALYSAIIGPFLFLPVSWWMQIKIHRQGRRR
jgi:rod shape-determining protein MreD